MRVNHNIASLNTQCSLFKVNRAMSRSLEKLSTGMRINRASDDAAGLGVSENLRNQVTGMGQAIRNAQDAMALLNIADGALNEQASIIQRMRELVVQAKNDTYSDTERQYMGKEFAHLMDELDRIAAITNYNGMQIFASPEQSVGTVIYLNDSGSGGSPHKLRYGESAWDDSTDYIFGEDDNSSAHHFNMIVGQNYTSEDASGFNGTNRNSFDPSAENFITIQFAQMDTNSLFANNVTDGTMLFKNGTIGSVGNNDNNPFTWNPVGGSFDFLMAITEEGNPAAGSIQTKLEMILKFIDGDSENTGMFAGDSRATGLERINKMRAYIGAMTNRLEHTVNNLMSQETNTQAAESVIRDTDFANETANFTKNQILTQSATAMLSQANMIPQNVLKLIG